MNIGFDFDKIFIDYPPFIPNSIIDRLYKKKTNGKLLYRIPSKPEQFLRILSHHPILRPVISQNLELVRKKYKEGGNKHYLISSRFSFLKKRTDRIIKKHNLSEIFDGIFFNFENKQPHIFKNEEIKKNKIERYIDDDFPLIKFLSKENPKTKFYWLNKKQQGKIINNLFAIKNISEIFK
ncbi:MAG: hypothetical protein Q8P80_03570 [Candidatus Levybacteria bacterium]|nr:hypothetical protein [Candidatus Levybacteria bacterium]